MKFYFIVSAMLWAAVATNIIVACLPWSPWPILNLTGALVCFIFAILRPNHDGEFWDEWRGTVDGMRKVMLIKRLIKIPFWYRNGKLLSVRVDLHRFDESDEPECFHNHPAWALRIILKGGYTEQVLEGGKRVYQYWFPGDIGIIRPAFIHRVASLNLGPSYSLWFRGPIIASTQLIGEGWKSKQDNQPGVDL